MENIGNFTVAKRWGSFLLLYLGYMILFADRTVMNISLAYIGKDFHVGAAALGATNSAAMNKFLSFVFIMFCL